MASPRVPLRKKMAAATLPRVKLGSSDLMVTKACLGTMTFGEQNTETEAHEQLDLALQVRPRGDPSCLA